MMKILHGPSSALFSLLLTTALTVFPRFAHAELWVQVGAFNNSSQQVVDEAARFGDVTLQPRSNGVSAVVVGPYDKYADAVAALNQAREKFPDAFLIGKSAARLRRETVGTAPQSHDSSEDDYRQVLSASEQRNVVLLDGVLHYKEGSTFTPLREYLANRD